MSDEDRKSQRLYARLRPRTQFPRTPEELFGARTHVESLRNILVAATECFSDRGYHGSSTRDIADRANMSPAAVYTHFSTKEQVLFTIIRIVGEWITEELVSTARSFPDPQERLAALVKLHVVCHAIMRRPLRVATTEFRFLNAEYRQSIDDIGKEIESLFCDTLVEGCKAKCFDIADPRIMCTSILALCSSVARWFSDTGALTPDALGEQYTHIVFRMVGADANMAAASKVRAAGSRQR
ncbi:TetR/AcrR family transcriptional regulator [Variovorax defluvii]|uniref:TetR/AcrR family transcriptional regulator n=1 Tax=Variovorax defluvii TaxID=913761 RepID=A0ABP8HKA9_9BURK